MRCDFTVRVFKENGTWRKVQCEQEATVHILNDCFAIVGRRCMEHAEWTVANGHARLTIELIEKFEGFM